MEGKQKRESFRKKAGLLAHHLRPAASAFALGSGASLAATLLRTRFTQIIRFTVDHALLGRRTGFRRFCWMRPPGESSSGARRPRRRSRCWNSARALCRIPTCPRGRSGL
ncbi:MAG: hypothetical protein ACLS6G_00910 [Christensenellales bacterium]